MLHAGSAILLIHQSTELRYWFRIRENEILRNRKSSVSDFEKKVMEANNSYIGYSLIGCRIWHLHTFYKLNRKESRVLDSFVRRNWLQLTNISLTDFMTYIALFACMNDLNSRLLSWPYEDYYYAFCTKVRWTARGYTRQQPCIPYDGLFLSC